MLNERRRIVLSALVSEYIRSAQPVGSKHLVDAYRLDCSPATVRNELAALEDAGHVYQPHVSAGRVPTDSGYRVYVDGVAPSPEGLTGEEAESVRAHYHRLADEIDDVVRETSALLTRLTDYAAVVVAPGFRGATIRRVDVVALSAARALVVVITDAGQVGNRHVDLGEETVAAELSVLERLLNEALEGFRASDDLPGLSPALAEGVGARLLEAVRDCLVEQDRARLRHAGTSALLGQPEFADASAVRPLIETIEDGLAMLKVLSGAMKGHGVTVSIGTENATEGLEQVSVVAAHYGRAGADGAVCVIGPTRMEYTRAMSAVRCVADALSEALGGSA
ncbi:MAG: heat-inducible transcription repressor HrcA [Coriobacteriia bacterium]|nr:heat-inducible transcription repressor HrcA [Coriobacteriia bacterium]